MLFPSFTWLLLVYAKAVAINSSIHFLFNDKKATKSHPCILDNENKKTQKITHWGERKSFCCGRWWYPHLFTHAIWIKYPFIHIIKTFTYIRYQTFSRTQNINKTVFIKIEIFERRLRCGGVGRGWLRCHGLLTWQKRGKKEPRDVYLVYENMFFNKLLSSSSEIFFSFLFMQWKMWKMTGGEILPLQCLTHKKREEKSFKTKALSPK